MPEEERLLDATAHNIRSVLGVSVGKQLSTEYNLDDGLEIKLILETITDDKRLPGREPPRVLEKKGGGFIEGCGGSGRLERIVAAFQKKSERDIKISEFGCAETIWTYPLLP